MTYTDIYIRAAGTLEDVAVATAPLIGADWGELWNGEEYIKQWPAGVATVQLLSHTLDSEFDEEGIEFSKYQFCMSVVRGDSAVRIAFAQTLYEKLKALKVPMMLVDNIQTRLDVWEPDASGTRVA